MGALLSYELLVLLLAGTFGAFSGWLLRRVVIEQAEADPGPVAALRAELARRDRELAAMTGRIEAHGVRLGITEEDLRHAHDELTDRERQLRELEADLSVHARISERALRTDDEVAALREGVRRVEAARRAAEDARSLVERDLEDARRRLAEREIELAGAVAKAEALAPRAAEAQRLQTRLDVVSRERGAEAIALRKRLGELEPLAARALEADERVAAATRDSEAECAALRGRASELEAMVSQARMLEGGLRAHLHDREATLEALRRRVMDLEPMAVRVREAEVLMSVSTLDKDAEIAALRRALNVKG